MRPRSSVAPSLLALPARIKPALILHLIQLLVPGHPELDVLRIDLAVLTLSRRIPCRLLCKRKQTTPISSSPPSVGTALRKDLNQISRPVRA